MLDKIQLVLKKLPNTPGIYQFFNSSGKIIYIGKSVNLKSRVNSYFNGKSKLNFAKQKMVELINDIKIILTNNETESLILETTLIKKHLPKYNILMKDGKNHVYIKITDEVIPKIIKTRIKNKNGTYFGPYTSNSYVNNIFKFIKKNFGYRSCNILFIENDSEIKIKNNGGVKIPCMDYHIGRCSGPCLLNPENIKEYKEKINQIKVFLKGNTGEIIKILEEKMLIKAKELKFEEAEKIKKDIKSIKSLNIYQIVREGVEGDYNIINYIEKFDKIFVGMIEIRDGLITSFYNYDIENKLDENKQEVLKNFIEGNFAENNNINNKITYLFPIPLSINSKIKFEIPKIGTKKDLLSLCYKNIYEYAYKSHLNSLSTKGFTKKTMQNILKILGYKIINKKVIFECNDISHISGNYTVASRSIIENGKSNTSKYKKFKIKSLSEGKIDDFGSMEEIMSRRIKELGKNKNTPDLIIIDGGKGQLSSVVKIINESNVDLQVVGIAKREEELFIPGKSKPILLDKDSNELRLIQKIRDEAHRFAITFNRDSRIKAMKKNILEELPGFGPKTRKKILNKYGNLEKLKKIDTKELRKILNKTQIETLENHGLIN
ncbi:MAG: excinuclease ABC subunit UvrC [Candidatus Gracilibacteria bacterium]